jgi:hypothetical protein
MFDIKVVTARIDAEDWSYAEIELALGDDRQRVATNLVEWSVEDYARQWRQGVQRLIDGETRNCLVTNYQGRDAGVHFIWAMWREGEAVSFHEQLVPTEQLTAPFNPDVAWQLVGPRVSVTEEGEPVSEWMVEFESLVAWYRAATRVVG